MSAPNAIRDFPKYIAELRRRVSQGNLSAMCDLGMWLQEGSQDRKGRSVLRSNPAYAFRLLKAAAEGGYKEAAASFGYAYDVGLGTKRNKRQAVRWYTLDYRNGHSGGAANLATVYRDFGDLRGAFGWWMRAAAATRWVMLDIVISTGLVCAKTWPQLGECIDARLLRGMFRCGPGKQPCINWL
jgi:TPR repeat protein